MPRPIQARIYLNAMAHNLQQVRQQLSVDAPQAPAAAPKMWAVVKANAYGHGIEAAVHGFAQADGLAMLDLAEAVRARAAGWTKPLLLLEGAFCVQDVLQAGQLRADLVVHDAAGIAALESSASNQSVKGMRVWLKVNTGMHRLGFAMAQVAWALERLAQLRAQGVLSEIGLITHFARADDEVGIDRQIQVWRTLAPLLTRFNVTQTSLANSAASLRFHGAGGHWARPGVALYGASPFADQSANALRLQPVMGLFAQVIAEQPLLPGEYTGYGGQFCATRHTRLGIVSCGYADGYPRIAPTGTPVLVGGHRTRTLGRVSMDMLVVDLTELPTQGVGSEVELWGPNLAVDEVAACAQTIGYELLCALAPRVPVFWHGSIAQ
jgi:alanine racemase